jgi:hypothetical protein
MNSITLKQKVDGQVEVSRVRISKQVYDENSLKKSQLKHEMWRLMEKNGIKVLKDVGIIDLDDDEDV